MSRYNGMISWVKKRIMILLFGLVLIGFVCFSIDFVRISKNQQPIFMVEISHGNEYTGYTNVYYGLGYWGSGQQIKANGEMMNYRFYFLGVEFVAHFG